MSLMQIFGLPPKNFIGAKSPITTVLTASYGEGKTTLLICLIKELTENGKSVYIIGDDTEKSWWRRLNNIGVSKMAKVNYLQTFNIDLNELLGDIKAHDYLIIDSALFHTDKDLKGLFNFVKINGIYLVVALPSIKGIFSMETLINTTHVLANVDKIIQLKRLDKITQIKSLDTNYKNLLFYIKEAVFWLFRTPSNIVINTLKNRYGPMESVSMFIDFEKINKIKNVERN